MEIDLTKLYESKKQKNMNIYIYIEKLIIQKI